MKFGSWQLVVGSLMFLISFTTSAVELKVEEFEGKNWDKIPSVELSVKGYDDKVKVQFATADAELFIRVRIPKKTPSLKHRAWVLENEKFVVGKQLEDSLVLRFSQKGNAIEDVWFWGANRTQWGFADDGFIKEGKYSPDLGKGPWNLNLRRETLHQNRSRYLKQKPEGSRGDVHVKALHHNSEWEIIFNRALKTSNKDDLEFNQIFELTISQNHKLPASQKIKLNFQEVEK